MSFDVVIVDLSVFLCVKVLDMVEVGAVDEVEVIVRLCLRLWLYLRLGRGCYQVCVKLWLIWL